MRGSCPAALFRRHFDGKYVGVIPGGHEPQLELALATRLQSAKGLHDPPVGACFLEDIEASQQRHAVAVDVENTLAVAVGTLQSVGRLGKS